jgi:uncharacterized protein (TIGR00255 family)
MIRSMTGYGKAEQLLNGRKIIIEIKSLNSKQLDLSLKIPAELRALEYNLRQTLTNKILRGKAEAYISIERATVDSNQLIDPEVASLYLHHLTELSKQLNIPLPEDIFSLLLKLPGIMTSTEAELKPDDTEKVIKTLHKAIEAFDAFRLQEGKALMLDIENRINTISELLVLIEPHEKIRLDTVRQRMLKSLQELSQYENLDSNRFEQELIYYLERLDITEEKVRLAQHCHYFLETIKEDQPGRKLAFITQEIGREINTIGSKANDANIQRLVVMMKDELEKVKEQLFNII